MSDGPQLTRKPLSRSGVIDLGRKLCPLLIGDYSPTIVSDEQAAAVALVCLESLNFDNVCRTVHQWLVDNDLGDTSAAKLLQSASIRAKFDTYFPDLETHE